MKVAFTILGQAFSKANTRTLTTIGGKPRSIKGPDALAYERDALRQIPPEARLSIDVPVRVTLHLYYRNQRPDLDESLLLDVLQDRYMQRTSYRGGQAFRERMLVQKGVYKNDRLVKEKHVYHHIDKENPRAEIEVEPLDE